MTNEEYFSEWFPLAENALRMTRNIPVTNRPKENLTLKEQILSRAIVKHATCGRDYLSIYTEEGLETLNNCIYFRWKLEEKGYGMCIIDTGSRHVGMRISWGKDWWISVLGKFPKNLEDVYDEPCEERTVDECLKNKNDLIREVNIKL